MKLVYVAGPYSKPDTTANFETFMSVCWRLVEKGYVPVSGMLWHPITNVYETKALDRMGYAHWLTMALSLLKQCDVLYRIPGESNGADVEVALARKLGIPVFTDLDDLYGSI
jgi:hypothetical protein